MADPRGIYLGDGEWETSTSREQYLEKLGLPPGTDMSAWDPVFAQLPSDPNYQPSFGQVMRQVPVSEGDRPEFEVNPQYVTYGQKRYMTTEGVDLSNPGIPRNAIVTLPDGKTYIDEGLFLQAHPSDGSDLGKWLPRIAALAATYGMGSLAFGGAAAAGGLAGAEAAGATTAALPDAYWGATAGGLVSDAAPLAAGTVGEGVISTGLEAALEGMTIPYEAATLPIYGSAPIAANSAAVAAAGAGAGTGVGLNTLLTGAGTAAAVAGAASQGGGNEYGSLVGEGEDYNPDITPDDPNTNRTPTDWSGTPTIPVPKGGDSSPPSTGSGSAGSALSRILDGTATADDWLGAAGKALGVAAPALGGYFSANQTNDSLMKIYDQQRADRAPALAKYNEALANPNDWYNSAPAMGSLDAVLRKLSVGGNPAENPGTLSKAAAYNLGGYNSYLSGLAGPAFGGEATQALLGTNAAKAEGGQYDGLMGGLGRLLNPQPTLADMQKYIMTIGGMPQK